MHWYWSIVVLSQTIHGPRNADENYSQNMSLGRNSIQTFFEYKGVSVVTILTPFSRLIVACNPHSFPRLHLEYKYIRTIRERMTSKPVSSSSSTEVQGQSHPAPAR